MRGATLSYSIVEMLPIFCLLLFIDGSALLTLLKSLTVSLHITLCLVWLWHAGQGQIETTGSSGVTMAAACWSYADDSVH